MSDRDRKISSMDAAAPMNCTCLNLRKAARAVTQMYDGALRPSGLKATQLSLLAALSIHGELALTQLAEALVMDRTTLTRNLGPLVDKGLIGSAPGADRRVRRLSLTEPGARALQQALPLWQTAQRRLVQDLGRERWSGLLDDLGATIDLALKA